MIVAEEEICEKYTTWSNMVRQQREAPASMAVPVPEVHYVMTIMVYGDNKHDGDGDASSQRSRPLKTLTCSSCVYFCPHFILHWYFLQQSEKEKHIQPGGERGRRRTREENNMNNNMDSSRKSR